jgi:hypothetical protein
MMMCQIQIGRRSKLADEPEAWIVVPGTGSSEVLRLMPMKRKKAGEAIQQQQAR